MWRELLATYDAEVRRKHALYGGVEVDSAGDGLLAHFDGPGRAIRCARAIEGAAVELGLEARAGVHTGEVERDKVALRGIAVHIAARIAALANAGEVFVSSTVRDLVAGSGWTSSTAGRISSRASKGLGSCLLSADPARHFRTWLSMVARTRPITSFSR